MRTKSGEPSPAGHFSSANAARAFGGGECQVYQMAETACFPPHNTAVVETGAKISSDYSNGAKMEQCLQ